jgi:hypothetical protein
MCTATWIVAVSDGTILVQGANSSNFQVVFHLV